MLHLRQVGSTASPELKASFLVKILCWKVVSFVLEGNMLRDKTLQLLRKVSRLGNVMQSCCVVS